jgi:plasmid stabilization system protein ParE
VAQIVWSDSALEDLRAIGEFYSRSSPEFAGAIVSELYESVSRLTHFPRSGRAVPELDEDTLREVICRGFRLIYELADEEVRVLTLLHARQDLLQEIQHED